MSVPLLRADSLLRANPQALQRGTSTATAADNASFTQSAVQQRVDDVQSELSGISAENTVRPISSATLHSLASVGASAPAPPSAVVSGYASACPQSVIDLRETLAAHPAFGAFPDFNSDVSRFLPAVRDLCASLPVSAAGIVGRILSEASHAAGQEAAPSTVLEAALLATNMASNISSPLRAQLSSLLLLIQHLSEDAEAVMPGSVDFGHLYSLAVPLPDMLVREAFKSSNTPQKLVAGEITLAASAGAADIDQTTMRVSNLRNRFVTIAALGAPVTHGKWYFEVELENSDLCQIGWARYDSDYSNDRSCGVGDNTHSWSWCSMRNVLFHGSQLGSFGVRSSTVGDVLGCRIDLDRKSGHCRIGYSHSGMDLGWAYSNVDISVGDKLMPLRPEVSLNQNSSGAKLNFGQSADTPLRHCPEGYLPLAAAVQGGHKLQPDEILALNDDLSSQFAARKAPATASDSELPSYAARYLNKSLDMPRPQLASPPCVSLRSDAGLTFEDTNERLNTNKHLTVELLIFLNSTSSERQLLMSRGRVWQHKSATPSSASVGGWSFAVTKGGSLEFASRQGSAAVQQVVSKPGSVPEKQWVHVAVSFTAGKATLLVNGSPVAAGSLDGFTLLPSGTNMYYIGSNNPPSTKGRRGDKQPPTHAMQGKLALLRVWRTARSGSDIAASMSRVGLAKLSHSMPLAAEFRMMEAYGNRIFSADGNVVLKLAGDGATWGGVFKKDDIRAQAKPAAQADDRPQTIASSYGEERLEQTVKVADALKAVLALGVPADGAAASPDGEGAAAGAAESKAPEGATQLPASGDMPAVAGMTPPFMGASLLHAPRWAPSTQPTTCRADVLAAQVTGTLMRLMDEHSLAVMVEAMGAVSAIGLPPPPHAVIHDPSAKTLVLLCTVMQTALQKLVVPNAGADASVTRPAPLAVLGTNVVLMCLRLLRETLSVSKHCVVATAASGFRGMYGAPGLAYFGGQGLDVLVPPSVVQQHVLPALASVLHTLAGSLPLLPEEALHGLGWGSQDLSVRLSSVFGAVQLAASGIESAAAVSTSEPALDADVWAALLRTTRDSAAAVLIEDLRAWLPSPTDVPYLLSRLLTVAGSIPEHLPWLPSAAEAKAQQVLEALQAAGDKKEDQEKSLLANVGDLTAENVSFAGEALRPMTLVVPASSSIDDLASGPGAYHMLYMLLQWLSGQFTIPSTRSARSAVKQIHQYGISMAMFHMDDGTADKLAEQLSSSVDGLNWLHGEEQKDKQSEKSAAWSSLVRGTCGLLPSCAALPLSSTTLPSAWEGRSAGFESLVALLAPGDVALNCTFTPQNMSAQHSTSSVLSYSVDGRSRFGAVTRDLGGQRSSGAFGTAVSSSSSGQQELTLWGEHASTTPHSISKQPLLSMSDSSVWSAHQSSILDVLLDLRGDGTWLAHRRSLQTHSAAGASSANSAWLGQHLLIAEASTESSAAAPAAGAAATQEAQQSVVAAVPCAEYTERVSEKTALSAATAAKWSEMSSCVSARDEGKCVRLSAPGTGSSAGNGPRSDARSVQYAAGGHVMKAGSVHSVTFKLSSFLPKDCEKGADNVPTVLFGFAQHPVSTSSLDFTKPGSRVIGLTVGPGTRMDSSRAGQSGGRSKSSYGGGMSFGQPSYTSSFSSSPNSRLLPGSIWAGGSSEQNRVPAAAQLVENDSVTLTLNLLDAAAGNHKNGHISVLLNGKSTQVSHGSLAAARGLSYLQQLPLLRQLGTSAGRADATALKRQYYAICSSTAGGQVRSHAGALALPWAASRPSASQPTPQRMVEPEEEPGVPVSKDSKRVPIKSGLISSFGKSAKFVPIVVFLGASTGDRPVAVELSELLEYKMAPKEATAAAEAGTGEAETKEEEATPAGAEAETKEAPVGDSEEIKTPAALKQSALPAAEELPFSVDAVLSALVLNPDASGDITPLSVAAAILRAASTDGRPELDVPQQHGTVEEIDLLDAQAAAAAFRDVGLPVSVQAWRVACLGSDESPVPQTAEDLAACVSPDALAAMYQRLYAACAAAPAVLRAAAMAPELHELQQPQQVPLGSDTSVCLPSPRAPGNLVESESVATALQLQWAANPMVRASAAYALWQRRSLHKLLEQLAAAATTMSSQVQRISRSPFIQAANRGRTAVGMLPLEACLPAHPALATLRALGEALTGFAPLRAVHNVHPIPGPPSDAEAQQETSTQSTSFGTYYVAGKPGSGQEALALVPAPAREQDAAAAPSPAADSGADNSKLPLTALSRLRVPRAVGLSVGENVEEAVLYSCENVISTHACHPYAGPAAQAMDEMVVEHSAASDREYLLKAVDNTWLKPTNASPEDSTSDSDMFKFWTELPLGAHPAPNCVEVLECGTIAKPICEAKRASWNTVLTKKPIVNAMATPPPSDASVPYVGQHGMVTVAYRMAAGTSKRNAMVGVALPDCNRSSYLGCDQLGYGLLLRGDAFHRSKTGGSGGSRLEKYCPRATSSTVLLCQLDFTQKSVKWGHASLSDMAVCQEDAKAMYAKQAAKREAADGTTGTEKLTQEEMDAVLAAACADSSGEEVRARYLLGASTVTWFGEAFRDLDVGSTIHAGMTVHGDGDAMEILGYAVDNNTQPDFSAADVASDQMESSCEVLNADGKVSAKAIVEVFQAGTGLHALALEPSNQSGSVAVASWCSLATSIASRGAASRSTQPHSLLPAAGATYSRVVLRAAQDLLKDSAELCAKVQDDSLNAADWSVAAAELQRLARHPLLIHAVTPAIATLLLFKTNMLPEAVQALQPELQAVTFAMTRLSVAAEKILEHNLTAKWRSNVRQTVRRVRNAMQPSAGKDQDDDTPQAESLSSLQLLRQPSEGPSMDESAFASQASELPSQPPALAAATSVVSDAASRDYQAPALPFVQLLNLVRGMDERCRRAVSPLVSRGMILVKSAQLRQTSSLSALRIANMVGTLATTAACELPTRLHLSRDAHMDLRSALAGNVTSCHPSVLSNSTALFSAYKAEQKADRLLPMADGVTSIIFDMKLFQGGFLHGDLEAQSGYSGAVLAGGAPLSAEQQFLLDLIDNKANTAAAALHTAMKGKSGCKDAGALRKKLAPYDAVGRATSAAVVYHCNATAAAMAYAKRLEAGAASAGAVPEVLITAWGAAKAARQHWHSVVSSSKAESAESQASQQDSKAPVDAPAPWSASECCRFVTRRCRFLVTAFAPATGASASSALGAARMAASDVVDAVKSVLHMDLSLHILRRYAMLQQHQSRSVVYGMDTLRAFVKAFNETFGALGANARSVSIIQSIMYNCCAARLMASRQIPRSVAAVKTASSGQAGSAIVYPWAVRVSSSAACFMTSSDPAINARNRQRYGPTFSGLSQSGLKDLQSARMGLWSTAVDSIELASDSFKTGCLQLPAHFVAQWLQGASQGPNAPSARLPTLPGSEVDVPASIRDTAVALLENNLLQAGWESVQAQLAAPRFLHVVNSCCFLMSALAVHMTADMVPVVAASGLVPKLTSLLTRVRAVTGGHFAHKGSAEPFAEDVAWSSVRLKLSPMVTRVGPAVAFLEHAAVSGLSAVLLQCSALLEAPPVSQLLSSTSSTQTQLLAAADEGTGVGGEAVPAPPLPHSLVASSSLTVGDSVHNAGVAAEASMPTAQSYVTSLADSQEAISRLLAGKSEEGDASALPHAAFVVVYSQLREALSDLMRMEDWRRKHLVPSAVARSIQSSAEKSAKDAAARRESALALLGDAEPKKPSAAGSAQGESKAEEDNTEADSKADEPPARPPVMQHSSMAAPARGIGSRSRTSAASPFGSAQEGLSRLPSGGELTNSLFSPGESSASFYSNASVQDSESDLLNALGSLAESLPPGSRFVTTSGRQGLLVPSSQVQAGSAIDFSQALQRFSSHAMASRAAGADREDVQEIQAQANSIKEAARQAFGQVAPLMSGARDGMASPFSGKPPSFGQERVVKKAGKSTAKKASSKSASTPKSTLARLTRTSLERSASSGSGKGGEDDQWTRGWDAPSQWGWEEAGKVAGSPKPSDGSSSPEVTSEPKPFTKNSAGDMDVSGCDAVLGELSSLLPLLAALPSSAQHLTTGPWLSLMLFSAHYGPVDVQRRMLRLMRTVLPNTTPASVALSLPHDRWQEATASPAKEGPVDAQGLVKFLLFELARAHAPGVFADKHWLDLMRSRVHGASEDILQADEDLLVTIASSEHIRADTWAIDVPSPYRCGQSASELVALLRALLARAEWRGLVAAEMETLLQTALERDVHNSPELLTPDHDDEQVSNALDAAASVATGRAVLSVCGGFTEPVRAGGLVELLPITVSGVDQHSVDGINVVGNQGNFSSVVNSFCQKLSSRVKQRGGTGVVASLDQSVEFMASVVVDWEPAEEEDFYKAISASGSTPSERLPLPRVVLSLHVACLAPLPHIPVQPAHIPARLWPALTAAAVEWGLSDDMAVASFVSNAHAASKTAKDVDAKVAPVGSVGLAGASVKPSELHRLLEDGTLAPPADEDLPQEASAVPSSEGASDAPAEPVPAPAAAAAAAAPSAAPELGLALSPVPRLLSSSGCRGLDMSAGSSASCLVMEGDDSELSVAILDTVMSEGLWLWEMHIASDTRGDEGVQLGLARQPFPTSADASSALHVQAGQRYVRGFDGAETFESSLNSYSVFGGDAIEPSQRTEVVQGNYLLYFSEGDDVRFVYDADNGALFMAVRHGEESRAAMQVTAQRIKANAEKVGVEIDTSAVGLKLLEADAEIEDEVFGCDGGGWVNVGQVASVEPGVPVQPAVFAWAGGKVVEVIGIAQVVAAPLPSLPDKSPQLRQESSMDSVCATLNIPKLAPLLDSGLLYQSGVESLLALRSMCLHLPFARRFLADDSAEDSSIGGGLQARQLLVRSALQITDASGLADRAALAETLLVQSGALIDRSKRAALAGAVADIRDSDQLLRNSSSVLKAAAAVSADPGNFVERPASALASLSPSQGNEDDDDAPTGMTPIPQAMSPSPPSEMESSVMHTAPRTRATPSSAPDSAAVSMPPGAGLFATPVQSTPAPAAPASSAPSSALPALMESPVLAAADESIGEIAFTTPAAGGAIPPPALPSSEASSPAVSQQAAPAAAEVSAVLATPVQAASPSEAEEQSAAATPADGTSEAAESSPAAATGTTPAETTTTVAAEAVQAQEEQLSEEASAAVSADEAEALMAIEAARVAEQAAAEERQAAADSAVENIVSFGFERAAVEAALAICGGDAAAAADMLFSNGGQVPMQESASMHDGFSFGASEGLDQGIGGMLSSGERERVGVEGDGEASMTEEGLTPGDAFTTEHEMAGEDYEEGEDEEVDENSEYSDESSVSDCASEVDAVSSGMPTPSRDGAVPEPVPLDSDDNSSEVEDFLEEETGGEHYNPSGRFFPDTRPPFSRSSRREFGSFGQPMGGERSRAVQQDKDDRGFLGLDSADAENTDVRSAQRAACGSRNAVFSGMASPYNLIKVLGGKKDIREVRARVIVTATNLAALAAREALVCLILQWPRCKAETESSTLPPPQLGLTRGDSLAASIGDMATAAEPAAFSVLEFFGSEVFVSGWDRAPVYSGPYGRGMPLKAVDPQMPAHPQADDAVSQDAKPTKLSRKARKAQRYLSVSSVLETPVTAFLALLRLETGRGFSPVWWPPTDSSSTNGGSSTTDGGVPPAPSNLKGVALTSTLSGLSTGENAASSGSAQHASSPWLSEEGQHIVGIAGSSCLDGSKPSLQSLLHSVLQQAMASTAVLPAQDTSSAHQPVRTVGATLRLTAAEALETQLRQAAHREFASFNWSGSASMSFNDSNIVKQPSLKFIQWLTDILLSTNTAKKLHAPSTAEAEEADAALRELFSAWAVTLRSPSMGLKEAGFRRLSDILGRAWRLEQAALAEGQPSPVRWQDYLRRVHAPRIEALAQRRLHAEMEDAPRCSRYLQTLLEFAAMLRFAQQRVDATASSSLDQSQAEEVSAGTALRFQGGMSYVTCQGVRGPSNITGDWTLELWVRRRGKAGPLAGLQVEESQDEEEAPVQLAAEGGSNVVSGDSRRELDEEPTFGRKMAAKKSTFAAPAKIPSDDKPAKKHGDAKVLAQSTDGFSLLLECGSACKDDKRSVGIRLPPGVSLLAPQGGGGRGRKGGERRRAPRRRAHGQEHSLPGGVKMVQSAEGEIVSFGYEAPPSEWVHLAFVFNGKSISLAVNGKRKGSARSHTINVGNRLKLALPMAEIGSRVSAMRADLMEVRMWRAARTPGEIKRDLGSMLSKDSLPGSLAAYLRMAEGMGTYISDFTEQNDRCFARGTSWVKVDTPPVTPQDNLSGVADAAALEEVDGVEVATAASENPPATPDLQDTPSDVASALEDTYSGDASSWREFVGHIQRDACPTLGSAWKQAGRQAVHVKWRRIDSADKQVAALAVLQQLNQQFAKHGNGHVSETMDADAAAAPATESKEEEEVAAGGAAESKDDDPNPAAAAGAGEANADEEPAAATNIPKNAVLVTGEVQLPEVQAQAPIVGWFVPGADWAPSRREPLVDVMRNDGQLTFFLRQLLTGPPDALSYLPGARFQGDLFGETLSGSWCSAALKSSPEPRVLGKPWLHDSLRADELSINGLTISATGSSWVTTIGSLNPPDAAKQGRAAQSPESESPADGDASDTIRQSGSSKAPSKAEQQKNWDEVMADALVSGRWVFEVQVNSVASAVSVGVATRGAVVRNYLGCERHSWGYQSNAQRYHKGSSDSYGRSYNDGNIVSCAVDMDKGTLEYFVDGASQGVAYTSIKTQAIEREELQKLALGQGVVPAISLASRGDSATMLGLKSGHGVQTWASGAKHADGKVRLDGTWYMGQAHGICALQVSKPEQGTWEGAWRHGKMNGVYKWTPSSAGDSGEGVQYVKFAQDIKGETCSEAEYKADVEQFQVSHAAHLKELASKTDKPKREPPQRVVIKGSFCVDRDSLFVWMPSASARNLSITDDLKTVSQNRGGSGVVIGSRGFSGGVHYWEIHLKSEFTDDGRMLHENLMMNTGGAMLYIGVAERRQGDYSSWRDYGYMNYMAVKSSFASERLYGQHMMPNDRIGVLLNMDEGTLTFTRDGSMFGEYKYDNFGPAFRYVRSGAKGGPLSRVLYPVIGLSSPSDPVTIKATKWLSIPAKLPSAHLSSVLEAATLLQLWDRPAHTSAEVPQHLVQEGFDRWVAMMGGHRVEATTRIGVAVKYDRSSATCGRVLRRMHVERESLLNLRGGDRVQFEGKGTAIVGAYRDRLWYRKDGQAEVWYFHHGDFDEMQPEARPASVAAEHAAELAAAEEADKAWATAVADGTSATAASLFVTQGEDVTLDKYQALLSDPRWTVAADLALVCVVNDQCDEGGVEPENLKLRPAAKEEGHPEWMTEECNLPTMCARFALLLRLNARLGSLLPLVDMTVRRSHLISTKADKITFASALGKRVADLRGLAFTRTKLAYWRRVLAATVLYTEPASENFSRAPDVPELAVNRVRARVETLARIESMRKRLRTSVFGQLMEQTSDWRAEQFRRDYSYEADLGQQRNFFVKLQNEGADDNGGPYRAVIEAASAAEAAGPLGLLVPCNNARTGRGKNRDKFVFNIGPFSLEEEEGRASKGGASDVSAAEEAVKKAADANKRQLRFLGLLAGTALRHDALMAVNLPQSVWRPLVGMHLEHSHVFELDYDFANTIALVNAVPAVGEGGGAASGEAAAAALRSLQEAALSAVANLQGVDATRVARLRRAASRLTFSKREAFVDALVEACGRASEEHMASFMHGLGAVVPHELLPLFTPEELETLLAGKPHVDVSILKRAVKYEGGLSAEHATVKALWQVLEDMPQPMLRKFLDFVSARKRLPRSPDGFQQPFKVSSLGAEAAESGKLPKGISCFFTLQLPEYTDTAQLRAKLETGILNSWTMDADWQVGGQGGGVMEGFDSLDTIHEEEGGGAAASS